MASDRDLDDVENRIAALEDKCETCRKAMALSRAAVWLGGSVLALVLTVAGTYRTPPVVFGAIAAVLGGIVWFGANKTSHEQAEQDLDDAEALKSRLFDEAAARAGWRDLTPTVH